MIHLITTLVRADARSAPGRVMATTVLLVAAGLLEVTGRTGPVPSGLLAGVIAAAAAAGAVAAIGRRAEVLAGNGAGPGLGVAVAVGSLVGPAIIATALTLLFQAWTGGSTSRVDVALSVLVAPLAAAALTGVLITPRAPGRAPLGRWGLPLLVVAALVFPTIVLPALVARALWRRGPVGRAACALASAAMVIGLALLAGSSTSFSDLAITLFVLGPPTTVAVASLGIAALWAVSSIVGRIGSMGRLATAPLLRQLTLVGPLVGVVAVVTSLAALDATVGASFGEREARREETLPTVTAPAGTTDDQVIASLRRVDVDAARLHAADAAAGTGTRVAMIDQVGGGGAPMIPAEAFGSLSFEVPLVVAVGPAGTDDAPRWLGVVTPDDLAVLGLDDHAADVAAGRALVLNPELLPRGAQEVAITSAEGAPPDSPRTLPAIAVDGPRVGVALPGAVVSPEVAATLGHPVAASRMVVVPDGSGSGDEAAARAVVSDVRARIEPLPLAAGLTDHVATTWATVLDSETVVSGGEQVVQHESGPLNDLPALAATAEEGRDRLVTWGALALLVTLGAVVLVLGATRADDAVLDLQGARPGLRAGIGSIQAGLIAGTASLLAAIVGVVLPAVAFATFAAHSDQPDIPLIVPVAVPVLLIGLPLATAFLSGLLVILRGDGPRGAAALADDLAW